MPRLESRLDCAKAFLWWLPAVQVVNTSVRIDLQKRTRLAASGQIYPLIESVLVSVIVPYSKYYIKNIKNSFCEKPI
jgi:hypothetical protein